MSTEGRSKQAFTHEIAILLGELKATQTVLLSSLENQRQRADALEKQLMEINNKINKAAGAVAVVTLVFTSLVQFIIAKFKGL